MEIQVGNAEASKRWGEQGVARVACSSAVPEATQLVSLTSPGEAYEVSSPLYRHFLSTKLKYIYNRKYYYLKLTLSPEKLTETVL